MRQRSCSSESQLQAAAANELGGENSPGPFMVFPSGIYNFSIAVLALPVLPRPSVGQPL